MPDRKEGRRRAERKAGELLDKLERAPHDRGNQHVAKFQPGIQPPSPYRAVLTESEVAPAAATHCAGLWLHLAGCSSCRKELAASMEIPQMRI